ncbi:MAG: hypothetical protein AAB840_02780 [Patescibacteria group bacterium]|mgnify:CR=1 FL=1
MENTPREHAHPISGKKVYGFLLQPFSRLSENDLYASNDGTWKRCAIHGARITGKRMCVRPIQKDFFDKEEEMEK